MTYDGPVRKRALTPLSHSESRYHGFHPGASEVLPAGYRHHKDSLPLPVDVIRETDVALTMRDGVKLYADVFRPVASTPVPAIVNWAPYGKGQTGFWDLRNNKMFPNHFGVPRRAVSGLQSWEGNDPAYWCRHGYAVVQVDSRGAFNSEGDVIFFGSAEGRDGHDAIEAVADMDWCSGKLGIAGNSWLAAAQWHIAAQRPPHLVAIAPWEGFRDLYRELIARGGIPSLAFVSLIGEKMYGPKLREDPIAMLEEHPLFDDYWADKVADVSRITVPAYVVASYTNPLHPPGTLHNWAALEGPKWLRVHNSQEWPDFYSHAATDDLRRFFDRYLLDHDNGWETTPSVRLAVLDPGHQDEINRIEDQFPPARTTFKDLFLNADSTALEHVAPSEYGVVGYDLQSNAPHVNFVHTFHNDVEVIGRPLATIWLSVDGHDDADIYLQIQKLDSKGRQQWHQAVDLGLPLARKWMPVARRLGVSAVQSAFYPGPTGMLRASRRGLDPSRPQSDPELLLTAESKISTTKPICVEIPLWPVAMRWHAGEQLRLQISGRNPIPSPLPGLAPDPMQPGRRHEIHTGSQYESRITLPIAPIRTPRAD
ncbi:CocE/NonD family hydrolase [Mycobacterium sp. pW049]|uniref:CocE/NonD family hydrolase n=1 Tax=[Mycobacterium] bulgaricum TaxID=3238985 RepID=UPI00351BD02A